MDGWSDPRPNYSGGRFLSIGSLEFWTGTSVSVLVADQPCPGAHRRNSVVSAPGASRKQFATAPRVSHRRRSDSVRTVRAWRPAIRHRAVVLAFRLGREFLAIIRR